jgi:poly(beta-D-mannuronate) lyase
VRRLRAAGLLAALLGSGGALGQGASDGAYRVRDPNAGLIDLDTRRRALGATGVAALRAQLPAAAPCAAADRPAPPQGRMRLPDYYLNVTHGPVDPAYAAAEQPYAALWDTVSVRASRYAAFGEAADARCVLDILDDWARAAALLDYAARESRQAWFMVEWAGSAAGVALAVVRGEPSLPRERLQGVTAWLARVARKQLGEPQGPVACCNNHAAWRGLMATAIGIVAADDGLFRQGVDGYDAVLEQIAPDGSLPLEMARHERALHYQNYAILPLVGIAELASRQGRDLYAHRSRAGRTIHDAVRFLLAALDDPAMVERLAGEPQYLRYLRPGHRDLAWMEAYRRRFPSAAFERHLPSAPFEPLLGGSAAVYWR